MHLTARGLNDCPATYQLLLETPLSKKGHFCYQHRFSTQPEVATHAFQLQDFMPFQRGRLCEEAPKLVASDVNTVGIRIIGREGRLKGAYQRGLFALVLYQLFKETVNA